MIAALVLVTTLFSPSSPAGAGVSAAPAGTLSNPDDLRVQDVAFSSDGKSVAATTGDPSPTGTTSGLDVWQLNRPGAPTRLFLGNPGLGPLAFSPTDGNALANTDITAIDLWSVRAGTSRPFDDPDGVWPVDVAYAPNGKTVAEFNSKGNIHFFDVASGQWSTDSFTDLRVAASRADPDQLAVSPGGKTLAAADSAGAVYVWQLSGGAPSVITGTTTHGALQRIAFSPDGTTLAVAFPASVRLWNVATRTFSGQLAGAGESPLAVAFSPNGAAVAVGDGSGTVYLWDLATRKAVAIEVPGTVLSGLAFSPDGKNLAVFGGSKIYLYAIRYASA